MAFLILVIWAIGIANIWSTKRQNDTDKQILNGKIDGLNATISKGQEQAKTTADAFSNTVSHLSDKVADLQSKVQNADLREEADGLRQELRNTQKAMEPAPKATLAIEIAGDDLPDTPAIPTIVLPATTDNHVSVPVAFDNSGDADALDGFAAIFMCDKCVFAKEVPGWIHVDGAPFIQRNWDFVRILSKTKGPTFTFEIVPPFPAKEFQMGFEYHCRTCTVRRMRLVRIKVAAK